MKIDQHLQSFVNGNLDLFENCCYIRIGHLTYSGYITEYHTSNTIPYDGKFKVKLEMVCSDKTT